MHVGLQYCLFSSHYSDKSMANGKKLNNSTVLFFRSVGPADSPYKMNPQLTVRVKEDINKDLKDEKETVSVKWHLSSGEST